MNLGIIGAMKIEVDAVIAAMEGAVTEVCGGIAYTRGRIGTTDVVCAVCGVGKVCAAMCAQAMIIRYAPDAIINTGVGGALSRALDIGDVAISTAVVQHDMDTSAIGDPIGLISGLNLIKLPADQGLSDQIAAILQGMNLHCVKGVIATGDQFVADPSTKATIAERFDAISCEMEGGAIGHVCTINHTPFCIIRAISDNADTGAVSDFPAFAAKAAQHSADAVIALARSFS